MTRPLLILLLATAIGAVAALAPAPAAAQLPDQIEVGDTQWAVRLADGSAFVGRVETVTGANVTFRTAAGTRIELQREQIRSMVVASAGGRSLWPEDPNLTRLFFGPTGRMMPQGEGYVAAFELFLPFVSYSLTDWFTIAGGTPLIPDAIGEIFYLAPKVGVLATDELAVSAGVLAFFSADQELDSAGILFGAGTWGTPDRALTAGAGWPFASGDLASRPTFLLGGEARTGRRIKLISENYLVSVDEGGIDDSIEYAGILSGGVRFIGDRLAADLGIGYAFSGDDGVCCLPLVNFVYHFGGSD